MYTWGKQLDRSVLMKRTLAFNFRANDSIFLRAGTTLRAGERLSFFTDNPGLDEDDVSVPDEAKIMNFILASSDRDLILGELGFNSDSFVRCGVTRPIITDPSKKPGDIDALICERGRPDQAVALQCKRVKVRDNQRVNKLGNITDAVVQANRQREIGFCRNYLAILVVTDGRSRTENNVVFRGPTPETFSRIYDFTRNQSLHEDVGLMFIELTQPTGKSFRRMNDIGVCIDKEARLLQQSPALTNRIRDLMDM
jgi:hypothetical protein